MATHNVFLDPAGTSPFGLAVIVLAPTGVTYEHQCEGLMTSTRAAEGFLVPVPSNDYDPEANEAFDVEGALLGFFHKEFRGNPPPLEEWRQGQVESLAQVVSRVPFWSTPTGSAPSELLHLSLDLDRIAEATEAWVPVTTPYGPGILVFQNCD
ncbi:hypothetical protein MYSTI_03674 [Myxococcus stipitatus DSM 14675]|uniref:Uncharacterized protein n=1 Tax=Myxococcus stipitatus (strain DSM 14675 / JCM 12634 / Mx s8) TaxID=1278073 RepID=L7UAW5_MYXSD|nr:DUF6210 family protein [Myxococcus stipitatus]AGC44980.1 hypothetical protein MYSTI_03674 [Myxococcus stipitatus DSM 14675]